jgi:hypothetical protein
MHIRYSSRWRKNLFSLKIDQKVANSRTKSFFTTNFSFVIYFKKMIFREKEGGKKY